MKNLSLLIIGVVLTFNGFTQEVKNTDLNELLKIKKERSTEFHKQNEDLGVAEKQRSSHTKVGPFDFGNSPNWEWTNIYGGSGADVIRGIVVAGDGSIFITGSFSGEISYGQNNYTSVGRRDAFLAKFESSGSMVWFQQFSALQGEKVDSYDIHIDNDGSIYFTGYYTGDISFGEFNLPGSHPKNLFLAKTDVNGQITMATNHNTFYPEEIGLKVDLDASGDVFVMGSSDGTTDFRHMTVIIKYDLLGNTLLDYYHNQSFADMQIVGYNIYYTGTLNSSDYFGDIYLELEAYNDAFVAKSNPNFEFAWAIKGNHPAPFQGDSRGIGLWVSDDENIYFTGDFRTNVSWGDIEVTGIGGYVARCSNEGEFLWANEVDFDHWDHPTDICGNENEIFISSDYQNGANPDDRKQITTFNKTDGAFIFSKNLEFVVEELCFNPVTEKVYVAQDDKELMRLSQLDDSLLDTEWTILFYGNSAEAYGIGMDVDQDEFIYNFGYASRPFNYFGQYITKGLFLAKQWGAGGVKWMVQFPNADPINNSMGNYLLADTVSKNVYITGRFYNPLVIPGGPVLISTTGFGSIFIIKYDFEGNFQWAIQEDIARTDLSLACDNSGNVLVSGLFDGSHTFGNTELVSAGLEDVFIVKYNSSGEQVWAQRAGGEDVEYVGLVSTDGQDNIYLTGEFTSMDITVGELPISIGEGDGNIILAKLNADGDAEWVRAKGGSTAHPYGDNWGWPTGIHTDLDGYTTVKGNCYDSAYFDNIVLISVLDKPENQKRNNKFVSRFDPNGNTIWAKSISEVSRSWDYNQFDVDQPGNVYIGLRVPDTIMFEDDYTYLTTGNYDLVIARYTHDGELDWVKSIASGHSGSNYLSSVVAYDEETSFVGGWFTDFLDFGSSAFTVNNQTGFIGLLGEPLAIPVYERDDEVLLFDLFPNPAKQTINLQLREETTASVQVWITDITGKQLLSASISAGQKKTAIDLSSFSSGVYMVRLKSDRKMAVKKLVID